MRAAAIFLSELRRILPPDPAHRNHALVVGADGRVTVQVWHHRIGQPFYLDEVDLDREPTEVAAEILVMIQRSFCCGSGVHAPVVSNE